MTVSISSAGSVGANQFTHICVAAVQFTRSNEEK